MKVRWFLQIIYNRIIPHFDYFVRGKPGLGLCVASMKEYLSKSSLVWVIVTGIVLTQLRLTSLEQRE
ncbi:MAG: hypothetical protein ACTSQI_22505 [Candidatus Helarchaeota archaeon]